MRQSTRCPKCRSSAVGRIDERLAGNWWNVSKTEVVGKLVGYLCTSCGFYETYVEDAQSIDWDQVAGFAWLNTSADPGPYR